MLSILHPLFSTRAQVQFLDKCIRAEIQPPPLAYKSLKNTAGRLQTISKTGKHANSSVLLGSIKTSQPAPRVVSFEKHCLLYLVKLQCLALQLFSPRVWIVQCRSGKFLIKRYQLHLVRLPAVAPSGADSPSFTPTLTDIYHILQARRPLFPQANLNKFNKKKRELKSRILYQAAGLSTSVAVACHNSKNTRRKKFYILAWSHY